MISFSALPLLYVSQLIYEASRWLNLTNVLVEDAEKTRIQNILDWTPKPEKSEKKGLITR